jgi:enamine deaminase RidA (YjgF/YER057c/UK114 family)
MDSANQLIFITDLKAQMATLCRIAARLKERSLGLSADDIVRMESVAYQLHNFYNAVEDLLMLIAAHFENNIANSAQWHSALLKRMMQDIPDVRPAVLSLETFTALNGLRGFRHFFRQAYEVPLNYDQLLANLKLAEAVLPQLEQDIETFLRQI